MSQAVYDTIYVQSNPYIVGICKLFNHHQQQYITNLIDIITEQRRIINEQQKILCNQGVYVNVHSPFVPTIPHAPDDQPPVPNHYP